ncbi:sugar transferase [Prevotella intermedia]|jgi:pilin glycosylation protein pglB|uniref:Sugar transferase n=1 Tax=Prevotella intermedia TaxID=28131 RepID=A0A2M8TLT9_PREIN|nr:sugar transferase [Prevotella intermedia]OWP32988.1 sugar transferase [Prevotella intermedia]PJI24900.1 sugar transferase [Prevotella intermedia]
MNSYSKVIKRLLDILISFSVLMFLSPFLLFIIILLYFANDGAGVFFLQERPGLRGKIFRVIKFKTMSEKKNSTGNLLPDIQRITPIGHFVRRTSLDELPQLINVLKGDMSLIGPRPLLVKYLPLYSTEQMRRHNVRPGISGWAQCHGRNTLSWTEKFKLDVWYVDHVSFITDVKVVFITIKNVLMRKDIDNKVNNGSGRFTQEEFNGQN